MTRDAAGRGLALVQSLLRIGLAGDGGSCALALSLFKLAGNRNAAHPINTILNYAYGILDGQ
jgi:hypothetical protein